MRYELPIRVALAFALALAAFASLLGGCASEPGGQEPLGVTSSAATSACIDAGEPHLQGVDTSSGQGAIDWPEARDAGVVWAVMKATQGDYDDDSAFARNWPAAKDAGVVRGAYHFFDPTLDGGDQAQYFLKSMGPLAAEDLSPMLDVECPTGPTDDCLGFTGGTGVAPAADFRARMLDWLDTVEAVTGRKPMIYTYADFFEGTGAAGTGTDVDTTGLDAYPLWIAGYTGTSCFDVPSPWSAAALWQYDDNGTFKGISGEVDVDHAIASLDELTGWPAIKHPSRADVNGDGKADVCGRDPSGVVCATSMGGGFGAPFAGPAWSDAEGWRPARYASTVQFADVNGDGKSDACGRAAAGVTCVLSTGTAFATTLPGPAWSDAAGWSRPEYYATIQLADVNGDGKSDVCGRGPAGITCALSTGAGFGAPFAGPAWSDAAGWNVPNQYRTIRFADLDGDGKSDVCGRSSDGIHCALSTGTGFAPELSGPAWSDAAGWGRAAYASTLAFVDVSGDGKSDVCGRSPSGIVCALSTGTGFGAPVSGPAWTDAAGWDAPMYYATIVYPDLDGDGARDVCGRGPTGITCALSTPAGFGAELPGPSWSDATGWNEPRYYGTIGAGDIDGDGKDDLCARGPTGVTCALSKGSSFGASVTGPAWSDATWGVAPYWATVATVGHAARAILDDDSGAPNVDGSVSFSASGSVSGSAGCSCRAAKTSSSPFGVPLTLSAVALALVRRKRRR